MTVPITNKPTSKDGMRIESKWGGLEDRDDDSRVIFLVLEKAYINQLVRT